MDPEELLESPSLGCSEPKVESGLAAAEVLLFLRWELLDMERLLEFELEWLEIRPGVNDLLPKPNRFWAAGLSS